MRRSVIVVASSRRPSYPHVHQINVSDGGIPKRPIFEAVVTEQGISGDRQHNRKVHGGPERAVCLFSLEVIERLQNEGHSIDAGFAGENLTLAEVAWDQLKPGSELRIGPDVRLAITSYCAPCDANARWFLEGNYKRISQRKHPGWSRLYASVLHGGIVRPGDAVEILNTR